MSVMSLRVFVLCAEFAHAHVQIKTHGAKAECRVEERTDFHTQRGHASVFFVGCVYLLLLERAALPLVQQKETRMIRKGKGRVWWSGRAKQVWSLLSKGLL